MSPGEQRQASAGEAAGGGAETAGPQPSRPPATQPVYLGIGSNVDAEHNIAAGVAALRRAFGAVTLSPVYRSVAVGFEGRDFLNLVARVDCTMPPLALKAWLNELESRHGRRRDVPKFSDRTLDIDILLYGDLWLVAPDLQLPRAEILEYAHVLRPLADLAPAFLHPVTGRTMADLWTAFTGERSGLEQVDCEF